MKIKTIEVNGQTYAVLSNGKPVYINDENKEVEFDAPGTVATISRLNGEAKANRERAQTAEATLKTFEGIADPAAAIDALDKVSKIRDKKLLDSGEVDRVRNEAVKAVEEKYAPIVKERDTLKTSLVTEKIGGAFSRSDVVAKKLTIPADMVQARFGDHFKLEGDAVVAYDKAGNKIFSPGRPGEVANFDEALEVLIEQYPYKNNILKGAGASGSGSQGGGHQGGKRSVTRAQFEALSPTEQASTAAEASAGKTVIVDG
jgi:hypothetical protein